MITIEPFDVSGWHCYTAENSDILRCLKQEKNAGIEELNIYCEDKMIFSFKAFTALSLSEIHKLAQKIRKIDRWVSE